MSTAPRSPLSPDPPRDPLALLRSLDARARPASEYFGLSADGKPKRPRAGVDPNRKAARAASAHPPAPSSPPEFADLFAHSEPVQTASGVCRRITTRCALDGSPSAEGYRCPADQYAVASPGEAFARLTRDARWTGIALEDIAFIDTETSGLAGGTGTYAFLVGVGRFEAGEFVVRQYFMEDLDREAAMLEAVEADLASASAISGYNSRCFDVPILETRTRLARRRPSLPVLHLDLLYGSRRLWRGRCEDCRLGTIERDILGIEREGDVESWLIPGIYVDYINGRHRERILPVVDHHAQDIFTLGALALAQARAVMHPEDARFAGSGEQSGIARILLESNEIDLGLAALERAIAAASSTHEETFGFDLAMQLARLYRRHGRIEDALAIWRERVAQARHDRLDPLVELAKHAEHRSRDLVAALRLTEQALQLLGGAEELNDWLGAGNASRATRSGRRRSPGTDRDALEHRHRRLTMKQARQAAQAMRIK